MKYLIDKLNFITDNNTGKYITFIELGKHDKKNKQYHQIYVHSKFLFTPEELIIGSPNLNERSLAPDRDNELAIHIRGYQEKIHHFISKIICEYFGEDLFHELSHHNLLGHLGAHAARSRIEEFLEKNLLSLGHYHFTSNNYEKDLIPSNFEFQDKLTGCAFPWGLISKLRVCSLEKPPRIPESSSALLKTANFMGLGKYGK